MKKFAALFSIIMAVTFSAGLVATAAGPSKNAPDKVMIKQIQKVKKPVPFDHKAHIARAKNCQVCHHKDPPGEGQNCSNCHKATAKGKVVSLKEAFHTTCRDCHKKEKAKGAPTTCNGCHKG